MRDAYLALPLSLLLLTPAYAADPPARVGRLSYAEGTVSFHPPGQGQDDWAPATVNYPVTTGEFFWTDANSRAEIEIGPAELRLDQASELDIRRLDDRSTDLQLDQGVLNLHLAQMPAGEISITTPRGRVAITAPADYDIDAGQPDNGRPSDQMQVSVFAGAAKVESERGAIDIGSGQAALISGEPMDVQLVAADPSDFDNWARDREHREYLARLPKALPPSVTGYQDLAAYGSWSDDPEYGEVWYPSGVPAGWAPYRYGHWAWVEPWGWTWIDDAPWGFAPFHYGRWIDRDDRWAWVPEDIPPQPVYAPALVAFVGGDGWGVDLAAGAAVAAIGWVALAPHESYHPHYHASEAYDRRVNGRDWNARAFAARNATLANFHNRQAATVVPTAAFTHAAPVQRAAVHVAPDQFAHARAGAASPNALHPSAFARAGRADPHAATAVVPRADAQVSIAHGRVKASTPAALAQQKAPTAPAPHPVAEAARPTRALTAARVPATAPPGVANRTPKAAAPAHVQNQSDAARPRSDNRRAEAPHPPAEHTDLAPQPAPPPSATAQRGAPAPQHAQAPAAAAAQGPRGPAPVWQSRDNRAPTSSAPPSPALAAHPAPPHQPPHETARAALPPRAPQTAARPPHEQHAATPPATAHASSAAPPAPAPPHQAAALPRESTASHHAPPAPAPSRPTPAPQVAHAPAPMPARAGPPPHPAAAPHPAPAPRPAAAPAPRPPAAPHPAPVAHPAAPAPHPAPAPHAAAAPAPSHPAPAAKAAPQNPDKDKKEPRH